LLVFLRIKQVSNAAPSWAINAVLTGPAPTDAGTGSTSAETMFPLDQPARAGWSMVS